MSKIILKSVFINSEKKDGTQFINKNGDAYMMAIIETTNGNQASMYIGQHNGVWDKRLGVIETWKPGDEVEVTIERNGDYTNFSLPANASASIPSNTDERLKSLELKVDTLWGAHVAREPQVSQNLRKDTLVDGDEGFVDVDDIPF